MSHGSFVARLALPALILLSMAGPSVAGPADYNFQIVGQPAQTAAGTAIKVRLTYTADGPVTGAHLYYQSAQPLNAKAWSAPGPRTAMQSDGQGNYTVVVHGAIAEGDPLHFVAEIPARFKPVASQTTNGQPAMVDDPAETVSWSIRYHKT